MARKEITCKVRDKNGRITHVGMHGKKWPVELVWSLINSGEIECFITDGNGNKIKVHARIALDGRKYLTTHPDGKTENDLDNLPDCSPTMGEL